MHTSSQILLDTIKLFEAADPDGAAEARAEVEAELEAEFGFGLGADGLAKYKAKYKAQLLAERDRKIAELEADAKAASTPPIHYANTALIPADVVAWVPSLAAAEAP
jgi:hypothetical protein